MLGELNIPGYTVQEALHVGRHTTIYRGNSISDNEKVVLKTPSQSYPGLTETAILTKEHDILSKLNIPGVNKALAFINYKNRPVIILEDFNGIPLDDYIKGFGGQPVIEKFLKIAIKITDILNRVHACHIIHKDINPHNILINKETEEIRLIDFGMCTMLSVERPFALNPNVLEGTLRYMSPEQTGRMNRSVDYRTDLYSLGITLYQILTGEVPFNSDDPVELVYCHIAKSIPAPHVANPLIPEMLSDIIIKLTAKTAEERYQSASGLKYDLEQCLHYFEETNAIPSFQPGQRDMYSRFRIPERLYGREQDISTLMKAFNEAESGHCKLMLISGVSGSGKTALINEIHKPVIRGKGYFIAGKCDQFKRNIPFNVFSQAFADIVRYLLSEPQQTIQQIKDELLATLGLNVPVLLELIPEFEAVIGRQDKPHELNPAEVQHRFFFTLREFIRVFADAGHMLTIFLDDLQWADDASLALIKDLVTKEIPYLFIVGTYRHNEVPESHPLALTIEQIRKTKKADEIRLDVLNEADVNMLVADTFQAMPDETSGLSAIIYKRTAGNPFYINELLKTIYKEGYAVFDHSTNHWYWDTEKISGINISGNVVEILTQKLKDLPEDCLLLLQTAACIGNSFDLRTLAISTDRTAAEVSAILWPAIEQEIILPLSDDYRLVIENEDMGVAYKFHHDHIQHAANSLMKDEKRKAIHLSIGRLLRKNLSDEEQQEKVIALLHHFNESMNLLTDPEEREAIAALNLIAGKKAQAVISYAAAFGYYKAGVKLLPSSLWQTHYSLAFELYKGFAQNAYQINNLRTAEEAIDLLLLRAHTKLEKVAILAIRLRQYATTGKNEDAIKAGIEGLKLLGMKLSAKPSPLAVLKELLVAKWNLGRRQPAGLLSMPEMSRPEKKAAARLLAEIGPSAYTLGNDTLYGLTQLKIVNLSLVHGNCPESSFAYISFGAVLADAFGNYKSSGNFGKLALDINEKLGDIEYRCRVIAAYGVLIHHFTHHWTESRTWFKKGIENGYLSGDLFFLAYCAVNCVVWDPKLSLAASIAEQEKYLDVVKDTGYADALDYTLLHIQTAKNKSGLTTDKFTLNDAGFNEAECLAKMTARKYLSGIGMFYINKAGIHLFYEAYEKAIALVREAEQYVKSMFSLAYLTVLNTVSFFASSGYLQYGEQPPVAELKKRMRKAYRKMKKWAAFNPENFMHLQLLMEAEMASIDHDPAKAESLYESAVNTANKNGWQSDEALANELAAKHYYKSGREKAAMGYFREAYYLYNKWGALGKTRFMEEQYPGLFNLTMDETASTLRKQGTMANSYSGSDSTQLLDVATIVRYSQTISSEISIRSLLDKMMHIIIMNAGAENGVLMLAHDGDLLIEAIAENGAISIMQHTPVKDNPDLPLSIVNYVFNTGQAVVLKDAAEDAKYTNDEYIARKNVKSVLCSPIVLLNKTYGIIYLENNILANAFTEDRLKVLQLLSSQMGISIYNATLYANLEEKVEERTAELKEEKQRSDSLLYNILPEAIAEEIKNSGYANAQHYDAVTVLFTDFVNFTMASERMTAQELVDELHQYFKAFDEIVSKYNIEKIKTVGDAYLAVSGLPLADPNHAVNIVRAAIDIRQFVEEQKQLLGDNKAFDIRIGIHSGPVVAGVVGIRKFAYDIWGDTVNTAARMEQSGESGKVNISETTYELVKEQFTCVHRGKIKAKNKGELDMYFVEQPDAER